MKPDHKTSPVATLISAGALLLLGGVCPAGAQTATPLTATQQRQLEGVALAQARTQLFERVRTLPLDARHTVADWLAPDADLGRALRLWTRDQKRHGDVRLYSDNVCEVDLRVDRDALHTQLSALIAEYPAAAGKAKLTTVQLTRAARGWPALWQTGRASLPRHAPPGHPAGWEDVTREGIDLARAAASADALDALLATTGRLQVTTTQRLEDFFASSDAVRAAAATELRRGAHLAVAFEPDQLALATATISLHDLLRVLTRVHQEHYAGSDFAAADFRAMVMSSGQGDVVATGLADPPARTILRRRYVPIEYDTPGWAAKSLTATGHYTPAEGTTPDSITLGWAAWLDGVDKLRAKIERIVIKDRVTVGEFLGYHQELKDDVALLLGSARPAESVTTLADGAVELDVELPLRRLWEIVRRRMVAEEVEPPVDAAAQPRKGTP